MLFSGPPGNPSTAEWCLFFFLSSYHLQVSVSITQDCWLLRFYHKSHNIMYFLSKPPLKSTNYKKIPSHFLWCWYIILTVAEKGLGHENLNSPKLHIFNFVAFMAVFLIWASGSYLWMLILSHRRVTCFHEMTLSYISLFCAAHLKCILLSGQQQCRWLIKDNKPYIHILIHLQRSEM